MDWDYFSKFEFVWEFTSSDTFIYKSMLNDNMLVTDFIILGPIPSNQIALLESKAIIEADTCSGVILGIWKYIPFGS